MERVHSWKYRRIIRGEREDGLKSAVFQVLNGFRIVAFWIFMALLVVSVMEAVRESKVTITVEDAVLGDKLNELASGQEFIVNHNGERLTVHTDKRWKTGDTVQLIFRNGNYYAIVNPDNPKVGVDFWERVNYRFTMATGGNLLFTFMAYALLLIITFKHRKGFRKEYPVLFWVTHVCGLLSVGLFILWCFWLDFLNLIIYGVIFAIIWIVRVISHRTVPAPAM